MAGLYEDPGKLFVRSQQQTSVTLQAEDHPNPGQNLPGLKRRQEIFICSHLQHPGCGRIRELSQGHDYRQIPRSVIGFEFLNESPSYAWFFNKHQKARGPDL
jgi:hypothetical protein